MNREANLKNGSRMFLEVMLTFCIMNTIIIKKAFYILFILMLETNKIIHMQRHGWT